MQTIVVVVVVVCIHANTNKMVMTMTRKIIDMLSPRSLPSWWSESRASWGRGRWPRPPPSSERSSKLNIEFCSERWSNPNIESCRTTMLREIFKAQYWIFWSSQRNHKGSILEWSLLPGDLTKLIMGKVRRDHQDSILISWLIQIFNKMIWMLFPWF